MDDMLYKAIKNMNAEDTMIAPWGKPKKKERQDGPRQDKGRKSARMNDKRDNRRLRPPLGRVANHPTEHSTLLSPHADKERTSTSMAKKVEWWSKQKAKE